MTLNTTFDIVEKDVALVAPNINGKMIVDHDLKPEQDLVNGEEQGLLSIYWDMTLMINLGDPTTYGMYTNTAFNSMWKHQQ